MKISRYLVPHVRFVVPTAWRPEDIGQALHALGERGRAPGAVVGAPEWKVDVWPDCFEVSERRRGRRSSRAAVAVVRARRLEHGAEVDVTIRPPIMALVMYPIVMTFLWGWAIAGLLHGRFFGAFVLVFVHGNGTRTALLEFWRQAKAVEHLVRSLLPPASLAPAPGPYRGLVSSAPNEDVVRSEGTHEGG